MTPPKSGEQGLKTRTTRSRSNSGLCTFHLRQGISFGRRFNTRRDAVTRLRADDPCAIESTHTRRFGSSTVERTNEPQAVSARSPLAERNHSKLVERGLGLTRAMPTHVIYISQTPRVPRVIYSRYVKHCFVFLSLCCYFAGKTAPLSSFCPTFSSNDLPMREYPRPVSSRKFLEIYKYKPSSRHRRNTLIPKMERKKAKQHPPFRPITPFKPVKQDTRPPWNNTDTKAHSNRDRCWQTRIFFDDLPKISVTNFTPRHLRNSKKELQPLFVEAGQKRELCGPFSCPAFKTKDKHFFQSRGNTHRGSGRGDVSGDKKREKYKSRSSTARTTHMLSN
eukprot:jgi/Bigna1/68963/fgenesh1_pg.7_\